MSDLLKDLKNYILQELYPDFDEDEDENFIFLDSVPSSPDSVIVISEYQGTPGLVLDERKVQILCRDKVYSTAKALSWQIRNLLDSTNPEHRVFLGENSDRSAVIKALQPPFFLQNDERNRVIFDCNYKVRTVRD